MLEAVPADPDTPVEVDAGLQKVILSLIASAILVAYGTYQAIDHNAPVWTQILLYATAAVNLADVFFSTNDYRALGLDAKAKAVAELVGDTVMSLIVVMMPLVGDGSLDGNDIILVLVTVIAPYAVYKVPNSKKTVPLKNAPKAVRRSYGLAA